MNTLLERTNGRKSREEAEREQLQEALAGLRRASLEATRRGDFRTVARLTRQTLELNQKLVLPPIALANALYNVAG